jgi:hypothetical protein
MIIRVAKTLLGIAVVGLVFASCLNQPEHPSSPPGQFNREADEAKALGIPTHLTLSPAYDVNPVFTNHTLTATATDTAGFPVDTLRVSFYVFAGPNVGTGGTRVTDVNGEAVFMYFDGGGAGVDSIRALTVAPITGDTLYAYAVKRWVSPPPLQFDLDPSYDVNPVFTNHTLTATVRDSAGPPVDDLWVDFYVYSGPNVGTMGSDVTDVNGEAMFTYFGSGGPGVDSIRAMTHGPFSGDTLYAYAVKKWVSPLQVHCDAGGPYTVDCPEDTVVIQLDGTGSTGDSLHYFWSTDCPGATFSNPYSPTPYLWFWGGNTTSCNVYLMVSDEFSSDSCYTSVSVGHGRPPSVTCRVAPLTDHGYADDDDDDGSDDGSSDDDSSDDSSNRVIVSWHASGGCGDLYVRAFIDFGCDTVGVSNGQIVDVDCYSADCGASFVDGVLEVNGLQATLVVTATDPAGNRAVCTADLCPIGGDDDDDDDAPGGRDRFRQ